VSYNEAETRFFLIDPVLQNKGYNDYQRLRLETPAPVEPTGPKGRRRKGHGRTDYLLCVQVGDMPKPLPVAVLEAKKESDDPLKGMQQAKGYSDCRRFERLYLQQENNRSINWKTEDYNLGAFSPRSLSSNGKVQAAMSNKKTYQPPYTITRAILRMVAIENNSLTLKQVTAVLDGKRVIGMPREVQEVRNAFVAYERLEDWNPASREDLLAAHGLLLTALVDEPGAFRRGGVGIFRGEQVVQHGSTGRADSRVDSRSAGLVEDHRRASAGGQLRVSLRTRIHSSFYRRQRPHGTVVANPDPASVETDIRLATWWKR
jgi:hypothetical protein